MLHSIIAFIVGLFSLGGQVLGATPALTLPQGGLGTTTAPANYVLIGKDSNRITAVATSSLGLGFSTTSSDYWLTTKSVGSSFSTTSASYFASLGLAFSTTSNDYWLTQQNISGFSTTSASYFASLGLAFSTTSANYWETQQTARTADDLSNNSIEDLNDVAAMTEAFGDFLGWNGTTWTNRATSTMFNTAASGVTGLLSGTDWTTFNNKVSATFGTTSISATAPLYWNTTTAIMSWYGISTSSNLVSGELLQATAGNTVKSVATSTLFNTANGNVSGLLSSADWSSFNSRLSTSTLAILVGQGLAFSTTSSDYWKTQNNFFSTSSASFFAANGLAFSTTSNSYWSSVGLGHSTTSVAYQLTQNVTLGNATSTNFFATLASSTNLFAIRATTTSLFASLASTSVLRGSGLYDCQGSSNKLTYNNTSGNFLCETDQTGGGGGNISGWATSTTAWSQLILYPVNGSEDVVFGGTGTGATTTAPFWWDVSDNTAYIGTSTAKSSSWKDSGVQFGPPGYEWTIGYDLTDDTFAVASGTVLGTNNIFSISKATAVTSFNSPVNVGTTTVWGMLTVASSSLGSTGYTIGISSNDYQDIFSHSTTTGPRPGSRVAIGTTSRSYIGDRWTLTVNGPMYSTWDFLQCGSISALANLTADSTFNQVCGNFLLDEDGQGASSLATTTPTGVPYVTIWAGATAVRTALAVAGDGVAIIPIGTGATGLFTASSSPAMEVWIQASSSNATSTIYMVGFWQGAFGSDYAPSDATVAATPGFGLVGTSSNWVAVVKDGTAAAQFSDTNVATSTGASDYSNQKINIDVQVLTADTYRVYFAINDQLRTWLDVSAGGGTRRLVNPRISVGARTAGNSKNIRVLQPIRVYQKMLQY